jgi:transposase
MNNAPKTNYRRYDEAFKRQAVEPWLVSGLSGRQIAAELGINEQSLKVWQQQFKQLPAGRVAPTLDALQAENRRLQRELRRAQEQRDILKNLGHNLRTERERFVRIQAMQDDHSIAALCEALAVSRSGYHAWATQ